MKTLFIALFYVIAGNWDFWVRFVWHKNVFSLKDCLTKFISALFWCHLVFPYFQNISPSFLQPPSHSCSPVKTQWSQRSVFNGFRGFSIRTWWTTIKAGGNGYSNGPLDHKVTKQEQLCLQKHKGPNFHMLSQIQIFFKTKQ